MTTRTLLSLLTLAAASAWGQSQAPAKPAKTLQFLTAADIDPSRLLPPPPEEGSDSQQREMAGVKRLVNERTKERYAQAVWDNEHEDATAFSATIGDGFDLAKLPATAKLLAEVLNEQSIAASAAKEYFHRRFPVVAAGDAAADYRQWSCDTDVKRPGERPRRSYPSGHATMGYSLGIVLAALLPEKAQAILSRSADYAYSREICADHYHSDVEASHALGSAIGSRLLDNAKLKPDIAAAQAELRAAGLTR